MDQDSTKSGTAGGERRNWRERLGVGQDLPRISDEFQTAQKESEASAGNGTPGAQASSLPGTPVARPAPMAPRYARAAVPGAGNGTSPGAETPAPKPAAAAKPNAGPAGLRPWAASHKPAESSRPQRTPAPAVRPGAGKAHQPSTSSTPPAQRQGYTPRNAPQQGQQRPQPTRGPAAYAQAAPAPRSVAAPSAAGNDSFGERLRAQREAAEKLAQQRLAAARDRSARSTHAGPEALAMLAPGRSEPAPHRKAVSQHELHPKPAATEQPRFTFAQEEIVAAQQETAFSPDIQPAPGSRLNPSPMAPTSASHDRGQAPVGSPYAATRQPAAPQGPAVGAPDLRAEYRHDDDGMFEEPAQGLRAVPARASAADYSAAYREFEDEFDEEPRKGRGPLLLLASLAGVAVVSGGLIYWYQQSDATPMAEVPDLPVVAAPAEPAKAVPAPVAEEVQQAAQTPGKQIYDRIIGEETLEPERLVPTEEEPQLRQILQPEQQQLPDSGETLIESQDGAPAATEGSQSTEPLPQPMPPPPGAGEQGDLMVPGRADNLSASASPEQASPETTALALPAPAASNDAADAPKFQQAAVEAASGSADSPSSLDAVRATDSGGASLEPQSAGSATVSSIYPELTEPLVYPNLQVASPEPAASSEIDGAEMAAGAEQVAALPEAETAVVAETKVEAAPVEPPSEQAFDVPLPKAKPQPPVKAKTAAKTAAKPAPQAQAERAAAPQPSGSGPVQIIPADVASGQAPAQARAVQPRAQPSQSATRKLGREPDPMAGGRRLSNSPGSDSARASQPAALQQVASIAPDTASQGLAGGGYVVQLASFRSESEALSDYQRLVARHPQLVSGLGSKVTQASLGASGSFYRLGVGPLSDRGTATKLCNALIAAGEKDCLVRRQ